MATVLLLLAFTVTHLATASLVNVALNKPASMSSIRQGYKASTAVDGDTDASGYGTNQIILTDTNQPFAWWKVDLQREVQNATVRIYFRTYFGWRRNGVELYTSTSSFPESNPTSQGQLCHTVTGKNDGSDIPDVYNVKCPGRWRYLLLYTDTDNTKDRPEPTGPTLDFGEVEVYAPLVNVALNKPASMSSIRQGYKASTAVDGDTDASGYGTNQIILTDTNQPFAWWKVDLQREVQDATVRIYFRTDFTWRRNGVELYTSTSSFPDSNPTSQGQLCHTVTGMNDGRDIPDVYNVTCPGRWRYLLLYTDTDNTKDSSEPTGPTVDFGEVEVYVTPCTNNNQYGLNCDKLCSDRKCKAPPISSCDRLTGQCDNGCEDGWRQEDCTQECGSGSYGPSCALFCINRRCLDGSSPCDHVTGQCVGGCQPGYQKLDCTQPCNQGFNYGVNCNKTCSDRRCNPSLPSVCDTKTGQCSGGCQEGWREVDCTRQETPVYFTAASVVGALIGTFLVVVLVIVGIILCLVRQGRLQWVKNPGDKKQVQVSRDVTQMSNIASESSDVSEHAPSSSHMYNNDYDVMDS